jgi:hypothetical protein
MWLSGPAGSGKSLTAAIMMAISKRRQHDATVMIPTDPDDPNATIVSGVPYRSENVSLGGGMCGGGWVVAAQARDHIFDERFWDGVLRPDVLVVDNADIHLESKTKDRLVNLLVDRADYGRRTILTTRMETDEFQRRDGAGGPGERLLRRMGSGGWCRLNHHFAITL